MNPLLLLFALKYLPYISMAGQSGSTGEVILIDDSDDEVHSTGTARITGFSIPGSVTGFSDVLGDSLKSAGSKRKAGEAELIDVTEAEPLEYGSLTTASWTAATAAAQTVPQAPKRPIPKVDKMDIRTLAQNMSTMPLDEVRGYLAALRDSVKDPIKDNCGWNLLHEAVYTDNYDVAQELLAEFGFDPNAFDPYFGSVVYLVQSKKMAELLKEFKANLNDQRFCSLYNSAVDSARSRRKLALVSIVENIDMRLAQMMYALTGAQTTLAATKFSAKRVDMFKITLGTISRRRTTSCAALEVTFLDEQGKDAGGLSAEFINFIKDSIIAHGRVLIQDSTSGYYQLRPDPVVVTKEDASREAEDLNEIKLLGYIVGLSIFHKVPLHIEFSPIMYQIMCGLSPHRDIDMMAVLKETDELYYRSYSRLVEVTENYISDYTFPEVKGDHLRSWKRQRGDLKTKQDLKEYIPLEAKKKVYIPYENSLAQFKAGLDSAIATHLIPNYITPEELKSIIIGQSDYEAQEWRDACKPPSHDPKFQDQYEWFWKAVGEMTPAQRASLLKYVTALVALPIGGFKALSYQPSVLIINDMKKLDRLPPSSTCFNQIRLYPVSSYEKMKELLIIAAEYGSSGFGDR